MTREELMKGPAVICGAGGAGRDTARLALRAGIAIAAFTDQDPRLHGTSVDGIPVISLEQGLRLGLPCIVASERYQAEISRDIQAAVLEAHLPVPALILAKGFQALFPEASEASGAGQKFLTGNLDILRTTLQLPFATVLDVGCGMGSAANYFANLGKTVTAIGLELESYGIRLDPETLSANGVHFIETSFEAFQTAERFDLIWMSHVLEHTQNVGSFLSKARGLLSDRGWLCVLVPPHKPQIVGGHVSIGWNLGLLMYNLLLSGYDIRTGHFITHGYNVAAFVKKSDRSLPPLRMDIGDLEATLDLWPMPVSQGFDGDIDRINWPWW
jgi:SAM-dependent methyltransferase